MKVVTFGEMLLRLTPPGYRRLAQADTLEMHFGGAEANVAVQLAQFGAQSAYITKLPLNDLGEAALRALRECCVDCAHIARGEGRLGLYFSERGSSLRSSKVTYDRAGSLFALSKPGNYDFAAAFEGIDWFHTTGIACALGGELPEIAAAACDMARAAGAQVSFDLNIRQKLWNIDQARKTLSGFFADRVDTLIANESQAQDFFGLHADTGTDGGVINRDAYRTLIGKITSMCGFSRVALTIRRTLDAEHFCVGGVYWDGSDFWFENLREIAAVERIGSGDCFAAGLIWALGNGMPSPRALSFAVAAMCHKHTLDGDFGCATVSEIESLMQSSSASQMVR